jgi:hypothetical protein
MANHLRQQIREAAAALLTGLTTTGPRVYQSRVYPLAEGQLPALRVWTRDESIEQAAFGGAARAQVRTLTLVVEACAKAGTDLDDTLDTMAKEVEVALAGATFTALAKDCQLADTEIELVGEGEQPLGVARLAFRVLYMTAANAPDAAL